MRAGGSITIGWNGSGGKELFDTLWEVKVLVELLAADQLIGDTSSEATMSKGTLLPHLATNALHRAISYTSVGPQPWPQSQHSREGDQDFACSLLSLQTSLDVLHDHAPLKLCKDS